MKIQLKNIFEEDVCTLKKLLVSDKAIPSFYIRTVASPIIRRWLLDRKLIEFQAEFKGCKFELYAPDTKEIFDFIESRKIYDFYLPAGVYLGGEFLRSIYFSYASPEDAVSEKFEYDFSLFSIKSYLTMKKVYFKGNVLNTEQLLRVYANKYGGVHLDNKREKDWELWIDEAVSFLKFGNPNNQYAEVALLNKLDGEHEHDSIHFLTLPVEKGYTWNLLDIEVLGMAQALINLHIDGKRVVA